MTRVNKDRHQAMATAAEDKTAAAMDMIKVQLQLTQARLTEGQRSAISRVRYPQVLCPPNVYVDIKGDKEMGTPS